MSRSTAPFDGAPALTPRQAAQEIGVTPQTVRNWCRAGVLPHFRFGAGIRLRRSEWDAFVASCRVSQTPPPHSASGSEMASGMSTGPSAGGRDASLLGSAIARRLASG